MLLLLLFGVCFDHFIFYFVTFESLIFSILSLFTITSIFTFNTLLFLLLLLYNRIILLLVSVYLFSRLQWH